MIAVQFIVNGVPVKALNLPLLPRAGDVLAFSEKGVVHTRFHVDQVAHMIDESGHMTCGLFCTETK